MKRRVLAGLLVLVMVLSLLPLTGVEVSAAKQEKKRVIGIVFDNSSSMYYAPNQNAWCRATYAMEVFASMMNEGDLMQVYPMNEIEVGTNRYTMDKPLVISGPDQAQTLRKINSPAPGRTHIETLTAAYNGLMKTHADERYLIVLTDGEEFYKNNKQLGAGDNSGSEIELTNMLSEYSRDMQVMYLGIGPVAIELEEQDSSCQHYDKAADSADTLKKLTAMCNTIFGRNDLPDVGRQISFDVSMSKLIVFVQGEDVSNVSVEGGKMISAYSLHYPEQGTDNSQWTNTHKVDPTLQGMLVTYGEFKSGDYALSYDGMATSVDVYYEPDVDMSIRLIDENGNEVDPTKGISSGVYQLEYSMVDRDGEPTASSLLGTTNYRIAYTINGEEKVVTDNAAGSMELDLHGNDEFKASFEVTYLNDYSIKKTSEEMKWVTTISPADTSAVRAEITGGSENYALSQLEEQAIYDVKVWFGSEQITGSDLANAELAVEISGGNAQYKVERTDDGFKLGVCYNGDAVSTECGKYTLSVTPKYTNRDGEEISGSAIALKFEISDNSTLVAAQFATQSTFFQSGYLDEADPIEVILTVGGAPLTAEQFAQVQVEIDTAGLECNITKDAANSRYLIQLPVENVENGRYKLTCHAQIPNEIGRMMDADDALSIEIQPFPEWVKLLLRILIILLILLLIWLYLNTKILPKKIGVGKCNFNVDGSQIPGSAKCMFSGGKKKRGILEVSSPNYALIPGASCGVKLELEAISPRRIKSAQRSVRVRGVTALNPDTTALKVASFNMSRDPITEKLVKVGGKADAPIDFNINSGAKIMITAEVLNPAAGGTVTVTLTVPLKYF